MRSRRDDIAAFIRVIEQHQPGISPEEIATFIALASDKALVYEIKGLPVPNDLKDDEAVGLSFVRTRTPGDA